MSIVRWLIQYLSGDDGYPLNCEEWQAERLRGQSLRHSTAHHSARLFSGWKRLM